MWRLHTLSTVAWQCLRGGRGPIRTPKNRFFERFCIIKSHWNSFSLFCLLFPLASCCRTLPWDKWKKSLLIARSWKNMRTDRSFQTKKPSLKTQIFYVIFLFNSTVELNFAIFYVGGHDCRCMSKLCAAKYRFRKLIIPDGIYNCFKSQCASPKLPRVIHVYTWW